MKTNESILRTLIILLGVVATAWAICPGIGAQPSTTKEASSLTTILVLRHADRNVERHEDFLDAKGKIRAQQIVHVLRDAGIAAIYTTPTDRTRQTVRPLAQCLGLKPIEYRSNIRELAENLLRNHRGQVVLVVGHGDTVVPIVEALTGAKPRQKIGTAFDDLHVVTVGFQGNSRVLSLKYGSPVETVKCGDN